MLQRASACLGLVLAALLGASYILGGSMPPAGTPPATLMLFLTAHSTTQEWSWFLACGPALLVGPWFTGVLTVHLWQRNPAHRYLIAAGFSTSLVTGSLLATAGVAWGLFVYLGTQITSPSLVLVLAESRHFAEGAVCFPAAGAVTAYSIASRAHLPAWRTVGWIGLLASSLLLSNGIDDFVVDGVTGPLGPASFFAFLAWLTVTSVALTCVSFGSPLAMPGASSSVNGSSESSRTGAIRWSNQCWPLTATPATRGDI